MKALFRFSVLAGVTGLSALSPSSFADQFSGAQLTLGKLSNQHSLNSVTHNPAAGELVLDKNKNYRWSYINGPAFGYAVGSVDNLVDEFDELADELDRLDEEDNVSEDDVEAIADLFDPFLDSLNEEAFVSLQVKSHLPALPLVIRSEKLKGVVALDATIQGSGKIQLIGDEIRADFDNNENKFIAETDSAGRIDYTLLQNYSIGYSHDFGNPLEKLENREQFKLDQLNGQLFLGGKLNFFQSETSTNILGINSDDEDDDFSETLTDDLDANEQSSSAVGIDIGAIWVAENYQLGLTWKNINEPEFDTPALSDICSTAEIANPNSNCALTSRLVDSGKLDLDDSASLENQLTVEAAYSTKNKNWLLGASLDLNEAQYLNEDENQWLTASASYFSDSRWIPAARLGYRANMAGSELEYVSAGVTLFGSVFLDLSLALDSVEIDEDSMPQSIVVAASVERKF